MTATDGRDVPRYARVAASIRGQIADGTLRPGQAAPSGAALSRVTGYSTLTCRKALRVLIADGLLVPGPSRNARPRVAGPVTFPAERDLSDARRALSAGLAARRRAAGLTQAELAALAYASVTTVGHAETGRVWQSRNFWERADTALGAGGDLLRLHDAYRAVGAASAVQGQGQNAQADAEERTGATHHQNRAPSGVDGRSVPLGPNEPSCVMIVWTDGTVTTVRPPTVVSLYRHGHPLTAASHCDPLVPRAYVQGRTSMTDPVTTVVSGFAFLEAPRWHGERIWFSDFYTYQVLSAREDGSDLRVEASVPEQPAGLGWLPDGRLLVVSMRDRRLLRREDDGTLVTHADLSEHASGHANDMAVDARGRAYVGNFGFDLMHGAPLEPAALYRVDPDGTVTEVATDLWFPNGSAITADNVLLVGETFGNRVTAFDVTDDGQLTNRRVWAEFAPLPTERSMEQVFAQIKVAPDGACLDAEGALWIADAIGGRLLRVSEGGKITDEIRPGINVYACALGGTGGKTLFACAAPDFDESARKSAREAKLLAFPVAVPAA